MALITLTFKCGHGRSVDPDQTTSPACLECGETTIARVDAPPPTFRGHGRGPLVQSVPLEPIPITVGLKEPHGESGI